MLGKLFGNSKAKLKPWMEGFVIYFIGDLVYTGIPDEAMHAILRFKSGKINDSDFQSLLSALEVYAFHMRETLTQKDVKTILEVMPQILNDRLSGYSSEASIRNYVVAHASENEQMSAEEFILLIRSLETTSDDNKHWNYEFLRFRLARLFQTHHSGSILDFSVAISDEYHAAHI